MIQFNFRLQRKTDALEAESRYVSAAISYGYADRQDWREKEQVDALKLVSREKAAQAEFHSMKKVFKVKK